MFNRLFQRDKRAQRPVGARVLEIVEEQLLIDEEWRVQEDGGLTWAAHRLCQRLHAEETFEDLGMSVTRVHATVPVVRDVTAPSEEVEKFLAEINVQSCGEAWVWLPDERRVVAHCYVHAHEATVDWRAQQLGAMGIIQLTLADRGAEFMAEALRGVVDEWAHPVQGPRTTPDDMLNAIDVVFRRHGAKPSLFANASEFKQAEQFARQVGLFTLGSSEGGIAVESAFGDGDTALVQLDPRPTHPLLGTGLLATLQLLPPGAEDPWAVAAALNRREWSGQMRRGQGFGAWCVPLNGPSGLVAHVSFLPNALFREGVVRDTVESQVLRAQWADQVLANGLVGDEHGAE
jgi:hypothetical protein